MPCGIPRDQCAVTRLQASPARDPEGVKKGFHRRRFWWSRNVEIELEFGSSRGSELAKKQSRSKALRIIRVPESPVHPILQQPSLKPQRFSRVLGSAILDDHRHPKSHPKRPAVGKKILGHYIPRL